MSEETRKLCRHIEYEVGPWMAYNADVALQHFCKSLVEEKKILSFEIRWGDHEEFQIRKIHDLSSMQLAYIDCIINNLSDVQACVLAAKELAQQEYACDDEIFDKAFDHIFLAFETLKALRDPNYKGNVE